jgi:hypothetical protein
MFTNYYDDQIKEDKKGETSSMHKEMTKFWSENLKGKRQLGRHRCRYDIGEKIECTY